MASSTMMTKVSVQTQFTSRPAARRVQRPGVTCSALPKDLAKVAGCAALSLALLGANVDAAQADVAGLTPCSESKAFAKLEKKEIKALTKRLKQYEADSAPALALNAQIEKTKARFDKYAKQGLLCGTDGLPHLIADPGLALRYGHAGDVFYPTIGFLYFAGWLGWSGSKYLQTVKGAAKPVEKEIIIDVPLAWKLLGDGALWPARAVADLKSGDLLEKDANITISPR